MKQSWISLLAAVVCGLLTIVAVFHNRMGAGVIVGLFAVYFMVRSEVLHRSGL